MTCLLELLLRWWDSEIYHSMWLSKDLNSLHLLTRNTPIPEPHTSGSENPAPNCVLPKKQQVGDNLRAARVPTATNLSGLWEPKTWCQLLSSVLLTIPPLQWARNPLSQAHKDCFFMQYSVSHWACIFLLTLKQAEVALCQPLGRKAEHTPTTKTHTPGVSAKPECWCSEG